MFNSKAKMERIRQAWLGLPESWRTHAASMFNTFVSTFVTELGYMAMTSSDFTLSRFVVFGALNAAVRATLIKPTTTAVGTRTFPEPKK